MNTVAFTFKTSTNASILNSISLPRAIVAMHVNRACDILSTIRDVGLHQCCD
jgi:hypothetical protein